MDSRIQSRLGSVFERSRHAMLLADDRRRYVDANQAAPRLLGVSRDELLRLAIDDFIPPERRDEVDALWTDFLATGSQAGTIELALRDGSRIEVEYSATANVVPGRHLSILLGPEAGDSIEEPECGEEPEPLTRREREVLAQVALGADTREIGEALGVSPDTARTHARNAMRKLGARNRAHAVALAAKHDLIDV